MSVQSFNQPLEDEVSLKDIIDFLSESWKAIALSGIVGGLFAAGYAFISPPKYQATANIQVAKIAGADVEPPSTLIEKLKTPNYFSKKVHLACNVVDNKEPSALIAKSIKVQLAKTSPIIGISVEGSSPEKASRCLDSLLDDIRINQDLLANPVYEAKAKQLMLLREKLDSIQKMLKSFPAKNLNFDFTDSKFSANTLLFATKLGKEDEVKQLQMRVVELEAELANPLTRGMILIAPVYAPHQKISPNEIKIFMAGLFSGLFFGLLMLVIRRYLHRVSRVG